jgi:ABC-type uncharacterized transport system permease subunit
MYLVWLRVALVLYGASCIAILPDVISGRTRWRRMVLPASVSAVFFHLVGLVEMLNMAHHWVPTSLHEVDALLALLLAGAFLLVYWRYQAISLGIFVLPLVFLLLLLPAALPDRGVFPTQWVRSGWIFVHITLVLAAYTALALSLLASLLYLVQERRLKNKQVHGVFRHLPPLDTIDQIAYKTLLVGFPCMTAGLLAGSLIAQESVGAVYFLDPKVLLSIGMWVLYIWLLYVRKHTGLRGKRAVYLSSLFFLLVLTVWVANQVSKVHRFVTP